MKKFFKYIVPMILMLFCLQCSMNRLIVNQTTSILVQAMKVYEEETNLSLAEQSIGGNLKLLEGLLEISPHNTDLLLLSSRAFALYSFAFIEDKIDIAQVKNDFTQKNILIEDAIDFYQRSVKYGIRLISCRYKEFAQSIQGDLLTFSSKCQMFQKEDVPALFWIGFSWGRIIFLNINDPAYIADLPKVELIMKRVLELNENYFYGGVHLFYGAYFGGRPKMFGGNLIKARSHLDRAVELSNRKFLVPLFFLVQYYAVPAQEKGLYQELIKEILSFPIECFPEQGLANQIMKRKALRWIDYSDELFLE